MGKLGLHKLCRILKEMREKDIQGLEEPANQNVEEAQCRPCVGDTTCSLV